MYLTYEYNLGNADVGAGGTSGRPLTANLDNHGLCPFGRIAQARSEDEFKQF